MQWATPSSSLSLDLLDGLEEAELDFTRVVAANVYLDVLSELDAVDEVYTDYLGPVLPARATVQQVEPAERTPDEKGRYPSLEQISLIAVREPED